MNSIERRLLAKLSSPLPTRLALALKGKSSQKSG
uniref:Uncharacterized protein n=1 Tax=Utricularia reniformis TaxID=192314 RepID=A0A1Y0B189_9LAMI|nr:hypothetical protein AEK19_MT0917 [Utricularia reniformis]ART31144.1 hypothetical protein AEK19_MT0917 [Utricularia reniformis]